MVTYVPALGGVNWWISRTFRPAVAAGHFPVSRSKMLLTHEAAGLRTLCNRYCGAFQILAPLEKNRFTLEHRRLSWCVNLPFRAWNKGLRLLMARVGYFPQCPWVHTGLLYIGHKM